MLTFVYVGNNGLQRASFLFLLCRRDIFLCGHLQCCLHIVYVRFMQLPSGFDLVLIYLINTYVPMAGTLTWVCPGKVVVVYLSPVVQCVPSIPSRLLLIRECFVRNCLCNVLIMLWSGNTPEVKYVATFP